MDFKIRKKEREIEVIFYTISGPTMSLEIRDDHLLIKSRGPLSWFLSKELECTMPLDQIRQFMVTRNYAVMGKITVSNGENTYSMTFSSPFKMVQMIEKYMQKRILKNIQTSNASVISIAEVREKKQESASKIKTTSPTVAA